MHYLFFPVPDGFIHTDLKPLAEYLNVRRYIQLSCRRLHIIFQGLFTSPVIKIIEIVQKRLTRSGNAIGFLKISVTHPRRLRELRDELLPSNCNTAYVLTPLVFTCL